MDKKQAQNIAVGLSNPSKMPCSAYSIPAWYCHTGSKLHQVKGSVCENCYALKNRYTIGNVKAGMERRYQSLDNPQWVEAMVTLIRETNEGDKHFFRWHDSGDIQSEKHLANICEIARRLPEVSFWLPTKEWKLVREYFDKHEMPENLNVRLSMPRIDQPAPPQEADDVFTYSEVYSKGKGPSNLATACVAKQQGNKCLDCRDCWSKKIYAKAYPNH